MAVDPVILPDARTIDVSLTLEHHFAPATLSAAPDGAASQGKLVELPGAEFHFAKVACDITLQSGTTKLLAVWKPNGAPEFEVKDVLQAAFLRVDLVPAEKK
jgi:hypothetical protein